jgi:hypothetical protein
MQAWPLENEREARRRQDALSLLKLTGTADLFSDYAA